MYIRHAALDGVLEKSSTLAARAGLAAGKAIKKARLCVAYHARRGRRIITTMAQFGADVDPATLLARFGVAAAPGYGMLASGGYAAVYGPALPAGQGHVVQVPLLPPGGAAPPALAPPVAPAPAPAAAATPAQTDAARAARLLRFGGDRSNPIE